MDPRPVNCLVVEVGEGEIGGRKLEAQKYMTTRKDKKDDWVGEERTYTLDFSNPVVLGQVLSDNNAEFSVFWSRGSSIAAAPSPESLRVGIHTGEDGSARLPEMVGYIVIEGGEQDVIDGVEFQANLGPRTVGGYVQSANSYSFAQSFVQVPAVVVVSQGGMNGNDGGWAVLTSQRTTSSFGLAVDEDQIVDNERDHINEMVFFAAFSHEGQFPMTSLRSASPSTSPSQAPTDTPSVKPSGPPTVVPSILPTTEPSTTPSVYPTTGPSMLPTTLPTSEPSTTPSV